MAETVPRWSLGSRRVAVAAAALLALGAAGLSALGQDGPREAAAAATPASLERGVAVYLENYCGVCHHLGLAGTAGIFGPPHDAMGVIAAARLADPTYRGGAATAADYIRESIVAPEAYLVPGYGLSRHRMPSYAELDEAELEALVALLLALPLPARPEGGG